MVRMGDANPSIVETVVENNTKIIVDPEALLARIKEQADAKKLEREIYQQYGPLKDIILNPRVQFAKQWIFENVRLEFFLGEPLLNIPTACVLLFMLQRKVSTNALVFAASLIFRVNPIYVTIGAVSWWMFSRAKNPKNFVKKTNASVQFKDSVPINYSMNKTSNDKTSDYIIIGSDITALFTAALLSRCGFVVRVIQPKGFPTMMVAPKGSPCPSPVVNVSIGKSDTYQQMLDCIQTKDQRHRVMFKPLGKASDQYTHTILRLNNPNPIDKTSTTMSVKNGDSGLVLLSLHRGEGSLMKALMKVTTEDRQAVQNLVSEILEPQKRMSTYVITKVLSLDREGQIDVVAKSANDYKQFQNLCSNTVSEVLERSIKDSGLRSVLCGLSVVGSQEALHPSKVSTLGLANALATADSGLCVPENGVDSLVQVLVQCIMSSGGEVISEVPLKAMMVDVNQERRLIARGISTDDQQTLLASKGVISCTGLLHTYHKLVPSQYVSPEVRGRLASLVEARPKIRVVHWVMATAEELELSSSIYVEADSRYDKSWTMATPNSPMVDEEEAVYSSGYYSVFSPSCQDASWEAKHNNISTVVVEFEAPDDLITLTSHSFSEPFALLPESTDQSMDHVRNAKVFTSRVKKTGKSGTEELGLTPIMEEKLKKRAWNKLIEVYPNVDKLKNKLMHVHIDGPVMGGLRLASNPAKFGSRFGVFGDIQNLIVGSPDNTSTGLAGELQAGWINANAALGYTMNELLMGRSVTADLVHIPIEY